MSDAEDPRVADILLFWFGDLEAADDIDRDKNALWWNGREADDDAIRTRFGTLTEMALAGELATWRAQPRPCLALVILLDQFTRSLGRGTPDAFVGDRRAQEVCLHAIDAGHDRTLRPIERSFLYMPLMHAEDEALARLSVATFQALSTTIAELDVADYPNSYQHAVLHAEIIQRFGRFPHRNAILGRASTPEEEAYRASGGPTFGQHKR